MRRFQCVSLAAMLSLFLGSLAHSGEKAVSPFNGKDLTGWKIRGKDDKNKWSVGTASVTVAIITPLPQGRARA